MIGHKYKTIYNYDSNGNKIESLHYSDSDNLHSKSVFKYDSNNNMVDLLNYKIEYKFERNEETLTRKHIYSYEYHDYEY